jgi:hypothetical protein
MSISLNIKSIVDDKNLGHSTFERKIGVGMNTISKSVQRNSNVSGDVLAKILKSYPEINPEFLILGIGDMYRNSSNVHSQHDPILELNPKSGKPNTLIADVKASAGMGSILLSNPKALEDLPSLSLPNAPFGLNIAFQITGDSMHPTLKNHDYVAANKIENLNNIRDGFVYIIIDRDDGVLCKRLYRCGSDFTIVSDNHTFPTYTRSGQDVLAVFKAFLYWSNDFRPHHDETERRLINLEQSVEEIRNALPITSFLKDKTHAKTKGK